MARARSSSYEVQLYLSDHWVIDSRFDEEAEARTFGRKQLTGGKAEGFRVIRNWERPDGRHVETEICQEFRGASTAITIAPIDDAPTVCHTVEEYYSLESRMTMNRLLRNYTERMVVTPTEILHNHAELKRLLDKDNLVTSALGRVAVLQAEKTGTDGRARRDEMFKIVDTMTERARLAAQRKDLPVTASEGFGRAFEALAAKETPDDCRFLARVVLARDLVAMRNWLAKLDFLADILRREEGLGADAVALLDGIAADVLGAPSVAQELLGNQRNMAEALCNLLNLAHGRLAPDGRKEDDRALALNALMSGFALDETRVVLVDLVRRQLKGAHPLNRLDPNGERQSFAKVLFTALTPDGVLGGGPMAEALLLRYLRFLEAGGATGRRQAINEITSRLSDSKDRLRFLVALADSDTGRQHLSEIGGVLRQLTNDVDALPRFVDRDTPIKANLVALTALFTHIDGSGVPQPLRGELSDNIDELLCAYILNSRVVERLDNPNDPLRHRATRLIQLCAPGTLKSRKALNMVRQRVVTYLRQPSFEEKYVADLSDPAAKQKALRDFHKLLSEGGFT